MIKVIINDWAFITSLEYCKSGTIWEIFIWACLHKCYRDRLSLLRNSHNSLTYPLRSCLILNALVTSCLFFLCSLSVIVGKDIKRALLWLWNISVKITCFCSPLKTLSYNGTSTCNVPIILLRRVPGSNNQACHRQMLMMALLG